MSAESRAVWAAVHAERAALVRDLAGVDEEAWSTPSLAQGWDVHDVLAHLVDVAQTSRLQFARRIITARFDLDADNEDGIRTQRRATPQQTLAVYASLTDATRTPPAPLVTRLIEEFAHGEDIRRPLGLHRDYPAEWVQAALRYLVRTGTAWGGGRERAAGLRLEATDTGFVHGTGWRVRGTGIALLVALTGRPLPAGELTGPGADRLQRSFDDRETWLRDTIDQHGWAVQHVGADEETGDSAFSYTVGLTGLGHPELVMTGMPFETAEEFLNLAGQEIRDGHRFRPGTLDPVLSDEDSPVAVIEVVETGELTGVEVVYRTVKALQLIWPDSTGTLPWQEGHRNPPHVQPFLGPLPGVWAVRR